jgi:hypothetical protein
MVGKRKRVNLDESDDGTISEDESSYESEKKHDNSGAKPMRGLTDIANMQLTPNGRGSIKNYWTKDEVSLHNFRTISSKELWINTE